MKNCIKKIIVILFLVLSFQLTAQQDWAQILSNEIEERATGLSSSRFTIDIESHDAGGNTRKTKLLVFARWDTKKDEKQSIAYSLEPASERGKIYLQIGRKYWLYFPKVRRSMPLSARASVQGDVSSGDLLAPPELSLYSYAIGESNGANNEVIFKAKNNLAPYGELHHYYIEDKLIRAELLSRSGIIVKEVDYSEHYRSQDDYFIPQLSTIKNKVKLSSYSVIRSSKQEAFDIPNFWFNPNNLGRIRP